MPMHISSSTIQDFGDSFLLVILEWIRDNFAVDDVYDYDTLYQWALDNEFVEKE